MDRKTKTFIGLDIGTSSVKGVLLSETGEVLAAGRRGFDYDRPAPGLIEIPADRYLASCRALLSELAAAVPETAELAGISEASASGNPVLVGEDGEALAPIVNWQDARVTDECETVLGHFDRDAYYRSTGWGFDMKTFPLGDLCWYRVHCPDLLDSAAAVAMSTEYLNYKLTGKWGIGTSAGTPFYLIDQATGTYRRDVLDKIGVPEEKLPPILETGSILGCVTEEASRTWGIPAGVPVTVGTFDHPSAARGVGVLREGQLLLSCGTSWVGLYPIGDRERVLDAGMLADPFLSEKGGPSCGMVSLASVSGILEACVRRYVTNEGDIYGTLASLASESEPGAGGLKIDPLGPQDAEEIARHPKTHIARAIMEGTVAHLARRIREMKEKGISAAEAVMVGGPSETPLWAKLIEEQTGLTVTVKHGAFAGAVGAAMLAGIAAGVWKDEADAQRTAGN